MWGVKSRRWNQAVRWLFAGVGLSLCGLRLAADAGQPMAAATAAGRSDVVVLLHGWWAGRLEMVRIGQHLKRCGYRVVNIGYPSVTVPLDELASRELPRRLAGRIPPDATRVHFVTHSMGGILLRHFVSTRPDLALGRVVMIGPPNRGSEVADRWLRVPGIGWIVGPNLAELSTRSRMAAAAVVPVDFEVGVIAGTTAPLAWNSPLPKPHDGKVSVVGTELAGMAAHTTVRASHSLLPWRREVVRLVERFLAAGEF